MILWSKEQSGSFYSRKKTTSHREPRAPDPPKRLVEDGSRFRSGVSVATSPPNERRPKPGAKLAADLLTGANCQQSPGRISVLRSRRYERAVRCFYLMIDDARFLVRLEPRLNRLRDHLGGKHQLVAYRFEVGKKKAVS